MVLCVFVSSVTQLCMHTVVKNQGCFGDSALQQHARLACKCRSNVQSSTGYLQCIPDVFSPSLWKVGWCPWIHSASSWYAKSRMHSKSHLKCHWQLPGWCLERRGARRREAPTRFSCWRWAMFPFLAGEEKRAATCRSLWSSCLCSKKQEYRAPVLESSWVL